MLFSGQNVNMEEYTPSAPPAEADICWQAAHNSPQVIKVFSTGRGEYSYLEFILPSILSKLTFLPCL